MAKEVWTHSWTQGSEGKGREGEEIKNKKHLWENEPRLVIFFEVLQTPATRLLRMSSSLPSPFLSSTPTPFFCLLSHYSLCLHCLALLSNEHRYNYPDTVAAVN